MEPQAYVEMAQNEAQHWWYHGMREITAELLSQHLPIQSNLKILDAGCGTGANMTALAALGQVYGIDYSALALDYTSRDHPGKTVRATVEKLPYADHTFDLVTSFDVLVSAEVTDDVAAIREFKRITKPGGYVLVRVAALKALNGHHDKVVHGVRRYTAQELSDKLEWAGLKTVRVTYANTLLLPLIFAARKLEFMYLSNAEKSDVQPTDERVNRLLKGILGLEKAWIGMRRNLPLGVSVMALGKKPTT